MEKITLLKPAYHKIHDDPKKNYGVHNVEGVMVLKGKRGAVHFVFGTGIYLPETIEYWKQKFPLARDTISPFGYDVGYHSLKPLYKGQKIHHPTRMVKKDPNMKDPGDNATKEERLAYINNIKFVKRGKKPPKCLWLGKPCYCDGSAMRAEKFFDVLRTKGSDEVWKLLEGEYKAVFGKLV